MYEQDSTVGTAHKQKSVKRTLPDLKRDDRLVSVEEVNGETRLVFWLTETTVTVCSVVL